jgi:uncharacterized membrane protein YGL010W
LFGQIDWASYLRVHSHRRNLVIHAFAVPLFLLTGRWWQQFKLAGDVSDDAA